MTRSRSPSLRLLSLNVNGLRDRDKRRCLFNLLERDRWDIILLQETHHSSTEEGTAWAQEGPAGVRCNWSGPAFWCHFTSQSRGVAVLLRPTASTAAITVRHCSTTGRTLLVDFTYCGQPYTVASVYAPAAAADRQQYYTQELLPSLPAARCLLVGGDFNCIAGQQDMAAGQPGQRTHGYWTGLRLVETEHQLYDVWRDLNPSSRAFTHVATTGQSAARLDRWLVSETLRARVSREPRAIGQVLGYPGDHLGVSLSLTAPASTLYGSAAWRLPLHLLDDQPFCDRVTAAIPEYLAAHPLGEGVTQGSRWVELKWQVKDMAMQRSWALAAERRASQRALESDSRAALAAFTRRPAPDTLLAWQNAHQLLQGLNVEAAKGAALQAGIVWQFYGEQSTFWFHHLARGRQGRTELMALRTGPAPDSPRVVLDHPAGRDRGGAVLREYYSGDEAAGLFAAQPVSLAAQDELLQAVDKRLSPQAAAAAEGERGDGSVSVAELETALRSLPRGKAPGLDGLPYEFYLRFWPVVGLELAGMLQEAFGGGRRCPPLTQGRITLLYKGKGADRESLASYRPITLLNTDYKLAARAIASRIGPLLNQVVDATQTGFLPKRWAGDNVLAHLEEISYLEATHQPGVQVFLDFEKAFDRLDRAWIERCMAAVGFGPGVQRWVHILHSGTTSRVAFNGWHTDAFPVAAGVFQGSPLSPLLFVLARAPMAAHARMLAGQLAFQPIRLPSGEPAPVMHQHADDTSVHARTPGMLRSCWGPSVGLHCAATGARLQRSKSQALGLAASAISPGPIQSRGVTFAASSDGVKHLGIPLSTQPAAAATALYTAIIEKVEARIARWSGFRLSLLGRAYVAKQVLASMVTYHATFIPVPQDLLQRLCRAIHTFVAANRPVTPGAAAALFPSKDVCFRAAAHGGIALVDIKAQILALQAKVVGRLLEPEQLAWKANFDHWLYRSTAWLAAQEPGTCQRGGSTSGSWEDSCSSPPSQRSMWRPRSAYGSTCMPTSSCGPITCGSRKRSATTQSWVSHCSSTGSSRMQSAALCLGGLGQAWPGQDQPPARCRARPGASGSDGARARAHPSGCLASSLESANPGAATGRYVVRISDPSDRRVCLAQPKVAPTSQPHSKQHRSLLCQWTKALQPCTHSFLRPRSLHWFSTGTSPGPGIHAAAHVSSASTQSSCTQSSTCRWSSRQGSSSQGSSWSGSSSCRSHCHHRRPHLYFLCLWGSQVQDPQAWGLGTRPAHEFVVREATARRQVLHRISKGEASPAGPLRPAIWADTTDDQRTPSGARGAMGGQGCSCWYLRRRS
uniref:Reverse transcriptase n=2 Tax=Trebouxiophyceae TaxID=75966 RepID=O64428_CHLVU|nr:reverse transcriptase [Chlorella vulgaris]